VPNRSVGMGAPTRSGERRCAGGECFEPHLL
jgi:hypothetical protein